MPLVPVDALLLSRAPLEVAEGAVPQRGLSLVSFLIRSYQGRILEGSISFVGCSGFVSFWWRQMLHSRTQSFAHIAGQEV